MQTPEFIYGTAWKREATGSCVELALKNGFRAFDSANQLKHYNEVLVGNALQKHIEKICTRKELFLQSKYTFIHGQDDRLPYNPEDSITKQVADSFASSLNHLHTKYLDSYLLHGPMRRFGICAEDIEAWQAIENIYASGQTKKIGVSNVIAEQLLQFCTHSEIKPMIVQNRCFAVTAWDKPVREICKEHNIMYQGFSLLTANPQAATSSLMQNLVRKYKKTASQIIFKFSIQLGIVPLTGTTSRQHMVEDLNIVDFELNQDEVLNLETCST